MRLEFEGKWLDFDLDLYRNVVMPMDEVIQECYEVDGEVADMLDYPLKVEHLLGIGLAAAQVYLLATINEYKNPPDKNFSKNEALSLGPRHRSGITMVKLINHGANYWKHSDEWNEIVSNDSRDRILNTFSSIGIDSCNPLYQLLEHITGTAQPLLIQISSILEEWHNSLARKYCIEEDA